MIKCVLKSRGYEEVTKSTTSFKNYLRKSVTKNRSYFSITFKKGRPFSGEYVFNARVIFVKVGRVICSDKRLGLGLGLGLGFRDRVMG